MFDLIFTYITYIGYALLAAFWVSIFLVSWAAWRAGRSRRYAPCARFTALLVALLWGGLFVGATPGASAYACYRYSRELFGRGFALVSSRHSYDSPRAFNGDGYSIEVFEISDAFARWAASPPPEFRTTFPTHPAIRSDWSAVRWHPTPIAADELKFLEFALIESTDSKDLAVAKKLLERLAKEPGNYIAYFYNMHGEFVSNVDFFLLSPSERVFIAVNHNT